MTMIKKNKEEVYALGKGIHMSAHKARRVIEQIRGRSYVETLMVLDLMPYQAAYPIFKLVYSAAANASHNRSFNKANLVISQAQVNEGMTYKKRRLGAKGRNFRIKIRTCHITIVLKEKPFNFNKSINRLENNYEEEGNHSDANSFEKQKLKKDKQVETESRTIQR
jgi:large subunit ribosomal protein L22